MLFANSFLLPRSCDSLEMGEAQLDSENHGDRDDTIINGGSTVSELIESLLGFCVRSGLVKFCRMFACPCFNIYAALL